MEMMTLGIEQQAARKIRELLAIILADTYVLYVKTQNYHWNIVDSRFYSLHKFFEEQYKTLQEMIDETAERIRMIGGQSPGSMKKFLELATLKEETQELICDGDMMIQNLLKDHEACIRKLREGIAFATGLKDDGTADLFIDSIRFHEKTAWMLRSHIASLAK